MSRLIAAAVLAAFFMPATALAHEPYTGKSDPVFGNSCCGGTDCAILKIEPGMLSAEEAGYRIRLTVDQAKRINPYRTKPVDTLISWERIQPSWDGNFHLCIATHDPLSPDGSLHPRGTAYCFWAPPNT